MTVKRALYDRLMDPDHVRAIMRSLCDLREQDNGSYGEFRGDLEPRRAVGIHTHAHHAARLARAVLVLDDANASSEVVPLIRLIFECGVTAAWLLLFSGSGDAMIRKGTDDRRKILEGIQLAGIDIDDIDESLTEVKQRLDELDGDGVSKGWIFEQHCLALAEGDKLYVLYRAFSAHSHAGTGIADLYLVEAENPVGVAFVADLGSDSRASTLGIATSMLFTAMMADELARSRPHWESELASIARQLGVSGRLLRADGTEMPARPRFGTG